jgi:hypothetical protein
MLSRRPRWQRRPRRRTHQLAPLRPCSIVWALWLQRCGRKPRGCFLAESIEGAALEIEEQKDADNAEVRKLKQLQTLLKELA